MVGDVLFNNPPLTYVALLLVVIVHMALFYTLGLPHLRAASTRAADTVGINVNRYRYINTMLGGMLAGLAGGFLVLEAVGQFQEGMTAGRGFIALAAMIFGNWMPFGAAGAAILFGYTQGMQNALLLAGVTTVPPVCEHDPVRRHDCCGFGPCGPRAPAGRGRQGIRYRRWQRVRDCSKEQDT